MNRLGEIADLFWKEIPLHHDNVILDEFVIMPNHIHVVIVINEVVEFAEESVATLHATSLRTTPGQDSTYFSAISPKKGALPTIIRSYKSSVTRQIRLDITPVFVWQPRYNDHIIRTVQDLAKICLYIILNPANWQETDRFIHAEVPTHA